MTNQDTAHVTPTGIAVALAIVIALGFLFFGSALFAPFSPTEAETGMEPAGTTNGDTNTGTLMITDTTVGTGAEATAGKTVTLNYTGMFEDGTVFDSSDRQGQPISFVLGTGRVISGWDQGLVGMKVGGKRHLVIPPELGYGPNDYGPIPGNSTLIFDVELLDVQ